DAQPCSGDLCYWMIPNRLVLLFPGRVGRGGTTLLIPAICAAPTRPAKGRTCKRLGMRRNGGVEMMRGGPRIAATVRFLKETDGPTAVEYALIIGLSCVAILAAAEGLWQAISYLYRAVEGPLTEATS